MARPRRGLVEALWNVGEVTGLEKTIPGGKRLVGPDEWNFEEVLKPLVF